MKSAKLLLITCVLTLTLCSSFFPVIAQPMMVSPNLSLLGNVQTINTIDSTDNLPSRITLGSPRELTEGMHIQIDTISEQNEFFNAAMLFNDKLQQIIAFFTSTDEEVITETESSTLEQQTSFDKCKLTYS